MRQLYVCSRPMTDESGTQHRHLIGILSENNGSYSFEYLLHNENTNYLILPIFPDKNLVYDDHDTRQLLDDYFPSEKNTSFMKQILKNIGMTEYDEWEWLKTFDSDDAETQLYETLPDDIIIHCDRSLIIPQEMRLITDKNDIINETHESDDDLYDVDDTIDDEPDNDSYDVGDNITIDDEPDDELFGVFDDNIYLPDDLFQQFSDELNADIKPVEEKIIPDDNINKPKMAVIKKTIVKTIRRNKADIIEPPLNDRIDEIKQRLETNKQEREEALRKKLSD